MDGLFSLLDLEKLQIKLGNFFYYPLTSLNPTFTTMHLGLWIILTGKAHRGDKNLKNEIRFKAQIKK